MVLGKVSDVVDPATVAARYRKLAAVMTARVTGVHGTGWEQSSPCEGWTVRDVVSHVVEVQSWPLQATGVGVEDIPSSSQDPVAAWKAASSKLVAMLDDTNRASAEIDVAVAGMMPAGAAVDLIVCGDLVVHIWDLSRATGQDERIEPAEVARMRAAVEFLGEQTIRSPGLTGQAGGRSLLRHRRSSSARFLAGFVGVRWGFHQRTTRRPCRGSPLASGTWLGAPRPYGATSGEPVTIPV